MVQAGNNGGRRCLRTLILPPVATAVEGDLSELCLALHSTHSIIGVAVAAATAAAVAGERPTFVKIIQAGMTLENGFRMQDNLITTSVMRQLI